MNKRLTAFILIFVLVSAILSVLPAMAAGLPYSIGTIEFTDSNGYNSETVQPSTNITVNVTVTKQITDAPSAVLVLAINDGNGRLQRLAATNITLNSTQPSAVPVAITMPNYIYGSVLKACIWNSLIGAQPLSDPSNFSLPASVPTTFVKVQGTVSQTKYSGSAVVSLSNDEVKFVVDKEYIVKSGQEVLVASDSADYTLTGTLLTCKVGSTNAKDLLEYMCVATIDTKDYSIITIQAIPENNTNITISSDNIMYDHSTISNSNAEWSLSYYTDKENDISKTCTISSSASYYYNGSKASNTRPFSSSMNNPFTLIKNAITKGSGGALEGTVTLLDNNGDGNYDVVFANENADFTVGSTNATTQSITSKIISTKSIVFDTKNADYDFTFIKNNAPATFSDIKKGDILSIQGYIDINNELEFGKVIITSNRVKGVVTEQNPYINTIIINGNTYVYNNWVSNNQSNWLYSGSNAVFRINALGKICACETAISMADVKLAYVTKMATSGSLFSSVQLRALLPTGEWKTYDLASKVSFNASPDNPNPTAIDPTAYSWGNWSSIIPNAKTDSSDALLVYSLASYTLNSDGKINYLDFFPDDVSLRDDSGFFANSFTENAYDEANKKLAPSVFINNNTIFYNTPAIPVTQTGYYSSYYGATEDEITVMKSDVLFDGVTYSGTAYNMNDNDEATVVVGAGFIPVLNCSDGFLVVDTVANTMNSAHDAVTKIYGYKNGQKVSFITSNDELQMSRVDLTSVNIDGSDKTIPTDLTYVKRGTVLLYTLNLKGEADKIMLLFNCSDAASGNNVMRPANIMTAVKLFTHMTGSKKSDFYFGYAYDKASPGFTFTKDNLTAADGTEVTAAFSTTPNVYLYDPWFDSAKGRVALADSSQIDTDKNADATIDGDYIFGRLDANGKIADAVIIKRKINQS